MENNKPKLQEEQRAEACKAYLEGASSTQLAKKYNMSQTAMVKCLKSRGIEMRPKNLIAKDPERDKKIIESYKAGTSASKLSEIYNFSATVIKNILLENNIELRTNADSHRIYPINTNFMDVIDTEEKAYFLGFVAADGCIMNNSVVINIKQSDKDVLYKIAKCIYLENHKDRVRLNTRTDGGRNFEDATLDINCKHMVEKMQEIGITYSKSLTLKYPELPDDINIHKWFIRGYYDGDGGGTKDRNIKIIGTLEVMSEIKRIALEQTGVDFGLHQHYTEDNKNIWVLVQAGNREKKKFLDFIYKDAKIYLDRKYNQYLELLEYVDEVNKIALTGKQGFRKGLVDSALGIKSIFTTEDKNLILECLEKSYDYTQIEKEHLLNRKEISKLVQSDEKFIKFKDRLKLESYIDKKFSKLLVINDAAPISENNKNRSAYLCKCDCGKEIIVKRHDLQTNNVKSCGCLK